MQYCSLYLFITLYNIYTDFEFVIIIYQVVEIVDRYEADCVPSNWTDKVAYIQSDADKTCKRQLHVCFLDTNLSFYLFVCYFYFNSVPMIDELWISNFDDHCLIMNRWRSIWSLLSMFTISLTTSTRIIAGIFPFISHEYRHSFYLFEFTFT